MAHTVGEETLHFKPESMKLLGPNGELIGSAELQFYTVPTNFCYIEHLQIEEQYRRQGGLESNLLSAVMENLKSRNIEHAGLFLLDKRHASMLTPHMFKNRKWEPVDEEKWPGWIVYNMPQNGDVKKLSERMIQTIGAAISHQHSHQ